MSISRRHLIQGGAMLGLTTFAPNLRAQGSAKITSNYSGSVVVNIFLRGAADGLQIVPPVGDSRYYDLRPTLALPPPGEGDGAALELDRFFGLHPALAPLMPFYSTGSMAVVHATGNPEASHSHFTSQDLMEGGHNGQSDDGGGWLGRHLANLDNGNDSAFRALAVSTAVQKSLSGVIPAFAISDVNDYGLDLRHADPERVRESMLELYSWPSEPIDVTTRQAFDAMDVLGELEITEDPGYPTSSFGTALRTLALLIKSRLGVEAASVDSGGWDHHDNLAPQIEGRLSDLAAGLATFFADLGNEMSRVTVVVMTEFGRRAAENASAGTDHGHGGVMFVLGAGVNGGRVFSDWPGLSASDLHGPGDLAVSTDYRQVLGEMLSRRTATTNLDKVFPGYDMPGFLGVFTNSSPMR